MLVVLWMSSESEHDAPVDSVFVGDLVATPPFQSIWEDGEPSDAVLTLRTGGVLDITRVTN